MSNIPSKWLDFVNNKELKRLRADLKNTILFRIQIALSAILSILSVLLSTVFKEDRNKAFWICISLIIIIVLLFTVPIIIKAIQNSKEKNIFVKGKNATTIFDEEVVYYVMIACEYSKQDSKEYEKLSEEVENFFSLEIDYYVNKAIEKLISFNSNFSAIFGVGDNKISIARIKNVVALIEMLKDKHKIKSGKYDTQYIAFKNTLNNQE